MAKTRTPHFRIYRGKGRQWRWTLVAGNGEIVASGEGYTRKADVERAIKAIVVAVLYVAWDYVN